jgi:O-succinylbenzoic acid--CoA ligase
MDEPMGLDLLAVAAAKWPRRIAVRSAADRWTYADLDYAATEIAGRVGMGSRVAFRAEMSIASIAAAWGIPRGGGIAVPIDPRLDVAAAAAAAVAFDAHLGWPDGPDPRQGEPEPDPARPAFIVTTSGSRGSPRGVLLTFGNIAAAASASQIHLGSRESDLWLLVMPLHHVAGLAILWRAAHDGATVLLHDRFDVVAVDAALRGPVTWVSLVPTMLVRLLRQTSGPWPNVRGALIGGAHAADSLIAEATAAGLAALPTYGMTETTGQVCTVRPGNSAAAVGTVGHPLPGVRVSVDAAPGEPGPIHVGGPTVSPGYVGEPARTGPFVTNDIGYFEHSGRLVVLGRSDDVVITGGENVHPGQVERALLALPGVDEAVVVGLPDEEWGERLVAVVAGTNLNREDLTGSLTGLLPHYAVPKELRVVEQMPYLSNGKPDRLALRGLVADRQRGGVDPVE